MIDMSASIHQHPASAPLVLDREGRKRIRRAADDVLVALARETGSPVWLALSPRERAEVRRIVEAAPPPTFNVRDLAARRARHTAHPPHIVEAAKFVRAALQGGDHQIAQRTAARKEQP